MKHHTIALARFARVGLAAAVAAAAVASTACSPPAPRSYDFFLLDSIARDGTLARCDRDPIAAQSDIECANARRAALAIQLEEERERRAALERESEAKIEALRREFEARRAREAAAAAEAAALAELALFGGSPPGEPGASADDAHAEPSVESTGQNAPAGGTSADAPGGSAAGG